MLSERAQAFLKKHKRRRHASDLDFVRRLFEKLGNFSVERLLEFQQEFAGYVSPTRCGQCVWGLTTSMVPNGCEHDGEWITPCTEFGDSGPRIDTLGQLYTAASRLKPVALSCFSLFEQMAFVWEWHELQDPAVTSVSRVAHCRDASRFTEAVLPQIAAYRVDDQSDQYCQLYSTGTCLILDRFGGATAWLSHARLPDALHDAFDEPRSLKCHHKIRFADRVRFLFGDGSGSMPLF